MTLNSFSMELLVFLCIIYKNITNSLKSFCLFVCNGGLLS
jgi:hypothetical protein